MIKIQVGNIQVYSQPTRKESPPLVRHHRYFRKAPENVPVSKFIPGAFLPAFGNLCELILFKVDVRREQSVGSGIGR